MPAGALVAERLPAWHSWFSLMGRTLEADPPDHEACGDFDPMYLGMGLDAFVAWRAQAGAPDAQPRVSWRIANERFELSWVESCPTPGVPGAEPEAGSAARPRSSACVASLALVQLARIVAAHGGRLDTTVEPDFGVQLAWPQFQECVA